MNPCKIKNAMAISGKNLSLLNSTYYSQRNHFPTTSPSLEFRFSFPILKFHSKHQIFVLGNDVYGDEGFKSSRDLDGFVRPVFPGGSWWSLPDHKEIETEEANFVTVFVALRRIWELISYDNQWVIFVAFGALTAAALSEITIPRILTTSIFSAQSGENILFSRSSNFLVVLWFTSGICSGLRSGFFGLANVILLNRIRETLYSAIICQAWDRLSKIDECYWR